MDQLHPQGGDSLRHSLQLFLSQQHQVLFLSSFSLDACTASCTTRSAPSVSPVALPAATSLPTFLFSPSSTNPERSSLLFLSLQRSLGVTYSTSSDHPIAVVGVQIAEAINQANDMNEANKDPDSVFISGNSRPCLIDFLMFGTLRQLKELNALSCLASPTAINWYNTVDDILQLLQIRRRLQYWSVC